MSKVTKQTINPKTKQAYEKLYGRSLSNHETFEINHNLIGFFNVLLQIDKRLNKSASNRLESSKPERYHQANPDMNNYQNSNKEGKI